MVIDFDFHKIEDLEEQKLIKEKVLFLAKTFNLTTVESQSGGLHLYVKKNGIAYNNLIGITLSCLIPLVDICCSKIIGPGLKNRPVIAFCGFSELMPLMFLPLNSQETKKFNDTKPHQLYSQCWTKGFRRRSLLALMKTKYVSKTLILLINEHMFNPCKSENELQSEILDKLDEIYVRNEYNDLFYQNPNIALIVYSPERNSFYK
jgi:hypothetical protein